MSNETMTPTEFIQTFESFSAKDRLAIAKRMRLRVLDDLFEELNTELPDVEISLEEIQAEVNAYRNEQKATSRS